MIDTPLGETSTVQELHRFTQCGPDTPHTGDDWFDTSQFPVFIRVINRPAVVETGEDAEGNPTITVLAEAEMTTYVLESEDIEVADNCVWLIVGEAPVEG